MKVLIPIMMILFVLACNKPQVTKKKEDTKKDMVKEKAKDMKEKPTAKKAMVKSPGLIVKKSSNSVSETLEKLKMMLGKKGISVYLHVKHEDGAKKANIPLRETQLLIFGNPKLGSHFFTSNQTAGIDLPMKVLSWKDKDGQVWIAYNDPQYIADRHGIKDRGDKVKMMQNALGKMTDMASGTQPDGTKKMDVTNYDSSKGSGLIIKKSNNSVEETLAKLKMMLKKKGISVYLHVKHEDGAKKANIPLRKTQLLIFGNPKLGSHFFTSNQTAGIDLPMKVLSWKDKDGQVWIAYNDPQYIADRHGIKDRGDKVKMMQGALGKMTDASTKK